MAILSLLSITKLNKVVASSAMPEDSSSSSPSSSSSSSLSSSRRNVIKMTPSKLSKTDYKKQQQQQRPSVLEIERAIGAGIFRDRDVNSGGGEDKTTSGLMDNILKSSVGKSEGSVEKSLRETGEWLTRKTDTTSQSAGKQILKFIFVWMIPLWITAFLVVIGLFRPPFPTPFLDDLIS